MVTIDMSEELEPNGYVQVDLRVRPQRPGPFTWRAFARPGERTDFIPLAGDLLVMVAWPAGKQGAHARHANGFRVGIRIVSAGT